MIEKILDSSVQKLGHEISFVLGHKILAKTGADWFELKGESLSISEWEDLKDFCLQPDDKIQLEVKGFVSGLYQSDKFNWKFVFTEKKECYKAYLSLISAAEKRISDIENPYFWEMIKKEKGLFILAGEKQSGKSSLLSEIISQDYKDQLRLTGIHSQVNQQIWPQLDSVIHLGAESIDLDSQHLIYDGIERLVVDFNKVNQWIKWFEFVEQGQSVILTISSDSINTLLQKLSSELSSRHFERLIYSLNGILVQKLVGHQKMTAHEILIMRHQEKAKLISFIETQKSFYNLKLEEFGKESYQSLNQSLIQKLVRRKIDVKSAFAASLDPDQLDIQLKKLGL